jgi:hypothetical protein
MSVCSVPEPSEQQRCKYCGEIIPAGDRRPREYCSDAHRKAASRTRRTPSWLLPQRSPSENSPATESAKTGVGNTNEINGRFVRKFGPSVPLNVFGRGYRWPGAKANGNAVRIAAAVDAELGVGGLVIVSPDGVVVTVVPSPSPRKRSHG